MTSRPTRGKTIKSVLKSKRYLPGSFRLPILPGLSAKAFLSALAMRKRTFALCALLFIAYSLPAWPAERAATTGWTTSDYLQRTAAVWPGQLPFLVSAWGILPFSGDNTAAFSLGQDGSSFHRRSLLRRNDDRIGADSRADGNTGFSSTSTGVGVDQWFHMAGGFIASDLREVWLNGGNKGQSTSNRDLDAPNDTLIGKRHSSNSAWYFPGALAEISIWDLAGFTTQNRNDLVTELASGRNPLAINADSGQPWEGKLVAYPDLDFNSPTSLQDLSGNGHDFTEVGTLFAFNGGTAGDYPPVDPSASVSPTQLALTSINGGVNPSAGVGFPVTVQAQDSTGAAANVTADTGITLSLSTGTGTLGGTLTGTILAGTSEVTISGVTYDTAETGVVITATATSGEALTAGDSAPFTVDPEAAAGLIAHWTFDEGSGTVAGDSSGNGNNGTLLNGPTWVEGKIGQAVEFDGVDDFVNVLDNNSLDLTQMTVSAWVKQSTAHNNHIVGKCACTNGNDNYLLQTWSDQLMYFSISDGVQRQVSSGATTYPLDTWFHLAGTYDGAVLRLYKDGVQVGSSAITVTPSVNTASMKIGIGGDGIFAPFNGLIDDVRIYNRALSEAEITALFNEGTAPPTATQLALTSINGGANPTAGVGFPVTVQAQDSAGAAANVTADTGITLSLSTGTGTLGGTLTGTILAGTSEVTINGLTYTKAESGVVITAAVTSGDALTSGNSAPFTVDPGAATNLVFTTQPGSAEAGSTIPGPPTVEIRDSLGNLVTSSTASITVAIGTNPSGGTLSGTLTKNATSGVASFSDLSIDQAGTGYTLTVSSAGLTGATSSAFDITASTVPSIASLSPTSGPVATSVTISGSNFGATQGTSTVTFSGVAATPTSWSDTSIVAPVPAGATTGFVFVTVDGVASNGATFTVVTTGTIAGAVTRASDGTPISGATVEALQSGTVQGSSTTVADGSYSIPNLAAGTYDVRASASGYLSVTQTGITVTSGSTTTVDFSLQNDEVWTLSNSASYISLLAPGANINSSVPGGGFETFSGTSMAAPHVAGAWAILKQKNPTATVGQILNALQTTGVRITDTRSGAQNRINCRIQIDQALDNIPEKLTTLNISSDAGVFGINNCGQIVGTDYAISPWIGFITDTKGTYTPFAYNGPLEPGAFYDGIEAFSINNRDQVVGLCFCGFFGDRGFRREPDSSIVQVIYPGSDTNNIFGNNDAGDMVGSYYPDPNGFISGSILFGNGNSMDIGYIQPLDINNIGRIVGFSFDDQDQQHGFYRDASGTTLFDYPGATETTATGINESGQIVGIYRIGNDSPPKWHGFLRNPDGSFISIDYPGATSSGINGINDSGQMVGFYQDAGGNPHIIVDLSW